MRPDIPRCDGDNPPSGQSSASTAVTWYAYLGDREPPLALGRSPEEAWAQLHAVVLRHYREDADPPVPDPEGRAAEEMERRRDAVLLSAKGPDEARAFEAWCFVSCLTEEEARRRWRRVFEGLEAVLPPAESEP